MQQKSSKQFTFQTRFETSKAQDEILSKNAALLSRIERQLFKDFHINKKGLNTLKSLYIKEYNITARQFNSCRIQLQGKVLSYKTLLKENTFLLEKKLKKFRSHIKRLKDPFKIHQKKRRLFLLEKKLEKQKHDREKDIIRICFGTKKLFRKQFQLEKNGFSSHEEWKKNWDEKRSNNFFLIGSKDETTGNQSCQLIKTGNTFTLFIRLPNIFDKKCLKIENLCFNYGQDEILSALEENELQRKMRLAKNPYEHLGKAINYRFKKDKKGWRVFVTVEKTSPSLISKRSTGAIGLDINANHIALAEMDRFGNLVDKKVFPCCTYGKNQNQSKAIIGDMAKLIITAAVKKQKPIVLEKLDFAKKKQSLREEGSKYSRMLSSFSYSQIISFIKSKAFREGIEVYDVNPVFTSIIGKIKFMSRYGLSAHAAAALVIARRLNSYSERLSSCLEIIDNKNSKSAFFLPVRNRKKHVWSLYRELSKKLKTANVLHLSTIIRSSRQLKLLCDSKSFDILPGKLRYVNSLATLLG